MPSFFCIVFHVILDCRLTNVVLVFNTPSSGLKLCAGNLLIISQLISPAVRPDYL